MLSFLKSYAEQFNLLPKIKLNTTVISVSFSPSSGPSGTRFTVKYKSRLDGPDEETAIEVDRIIIANGAYSQPEIPRIEGMENFSGNVSHTSGFRKYALAQY